MEKQAHYCLIAKGKEDVIISVLDSFFDFEWQLLGINIKNLSKNKIIIYQTEPKIDKNGILVKPWFIKNLKSELKDALNHKPKLRVYVV